MSIYLGLSGAEVLLPSPQKFAITEREICREGRLASGKLVKDVIAVKRTFRLEYNILSATDLNTILTEYDRHTFLSFKYPDRGVTKTATVAFTEMPRELFRTGAVEQWRNIVFTLVEQ